MSASTKTRAYRRWSPEERRAIATESFDPAKTVTSVAKKHGVSAVSLYLWRKEFGAAGHIVREDAPDQGPSRIGGSGPMAPVHDAEDRPAAGRLPKPQAHVDRVQELERQLAQLQADLVASRRQRALLVSVLTSIGAQLKLLAELEDAALPQAADDAG